MPIPDRGSQGIGSNGARRRHRLEPLRNALRGARSRPNAFGLAPGQHCRRQPSHPARRAGGPRRRRRSRSGSSGVATRWGATRSSGRSVAARQASVRSDANEVPAEGPRPSSLAGLAIARDGGRNRTARRKHRTAEPRTPHRSAPPRFPRAPKGAGSPGRPTPRGRRGTWRRRRGRAG